MKVFLFVCTILNLQVFAATENYAEINGIKMYYELHGKEGGVPLVLLHGGGSTIEVTYGKVIPLLSQHRRLIAVEEQGHGRTTDREYKPVKFETSADDVAALIKHLRIDKADLMGFSNGASVALQTTLRHPQLVRKLVFISSLTKKSGADAEFWKWMKQADFSNMPQPLKDAFLKVNPDPVKLKTMHDKDRDRMLRFKDVSDHAVKSIQAPTLIMFGDKDVAKSEHAVALSRLIPNSRLCILPGTHGDFLGEEVMTKKESLPPQIAVSIIENFLSM